MGQKADLQELDTNAWCEVLKKETGKCKNKKLGTIKSIRTCKNIGTHNRPKTKDFLTFIILYLS